MDIGMGVGRATGVVSLWFPGVSLIGNENQVLITGLQMQGVAGIEIDPKFEEPIAKFKTGLEM